MVTTQTAEIRLEALVLIVAGLQAFDFGAQAF